MQIYQICIVARITISKRNQHLAIVSSLMVYRTMAIGAGYRLTGHTPADRALYCGARAGMAKGAAQGVLLVNNRKLAQMALVTGRWGDNRIVNSRVTGDDG